MTSNIAQKIHGKSPSFQEETGGVLPCQTIEAMVKAGQIIIADKELGQIQPASLDLRLGSEAYPVDTSFLPGAQMTVVEKMRQLDARFESFKLDLSQGAVLEKGRVYLVPLQEQLALAADIKGFANPKSSTGRLDILTRLITDQGTAFDRVDAGYKGMLYLEIVPRSFSVVVKTGTRLNQLRFLSKSDRAVSVAKDEWEGLLKDDQIIARSDDTRSGLEDPGLLRFTVDLEGNGSLGDLIGYRAKRHAKRIDLEQHNYDPAEFWEPLYGAKNRSLILDPNEFYILVTKEAVAIPPDYAAEMIPYDTRAGEFRVHYAGFFDPGFGWNEKTGKAGSSRAVLEVRSHEVPFLLEHGQTVGWLRFAKMAQRPERLYGQGINSNYQDQGLKLAKQFRSER